MRLTPIATQTISGPRNGGGISLKAVLGVGPTGATGPTGPTGPSGGPFPDLTGVTAGKVPQTLGGGAVEFVDLSATIATQVPEVGDDRYALIGASLQQAPGKNLFDVASAQADKFWTSPSATAPVSSGYAGWTASARIPVTTGAVYTVNNARAIVQFADATSASISALYINNPTEGTKTFTAGEAVYATALPFDATADTVTQAFHTLTANQKVRLTAIAGGLTGVTTGVDYYVRDVTTNTFKLALTPGGAAIDITASGTATINTYAAVTYVAYSMASTKAAVSQIELGSSATSWEPYGVRVQKLLANGRYLEDTLNQQGAMVRRAGGITVYKTGNDMLIRSAHDATYDLFRPLSLARASVSGFETMVSFCIGQPTSGYTTVQIADRNLTDAAVWPVPSAIFGTEIQDPNDDPCPINHAIVGVYVGGSGHGWNHGVTVTMTAHGKVTADLGSTWTDGTRTYTLLKILTANTLLFGCPYTVTSGRVDGGQTVPSTTLTHVAGATNTANITVSGGKTLTDIHPVTHSRTVEARLDGQPLVDGTASGRWLTITETYTIVSYKGLLDWAQAHVGTDPFANLASMLQFARISNTYRVTGKGLMIAGQTITCMVSGGTETAINLNAGITQMNALTLPAGGVRKQIMAGVGTVAGMDFTTLADMSAQTGNASIVLANQTVPADPAQRAVQWAYDADGTTKRWGMSLGLLPVMDGKRATRRANGSDAQSWFIATSTKKNYPQLVHQKVLTAGQSLSGVAFRRYLAAGDPPEQLITDGSRTWLMIDRPDATTTAQVAKAPEVLGRKLVPDGSTTLTMPRTYVDGEGVTYTNTAPGYLLAEAVIDTSV